ncbi:MAG: hypothetical protein L6276_11775 [Acetobacterium sp.]|uniref:Uncharacterized protein n=1 Tax=Acetobacterium malicum TaxID=52692 RepID=A0ABR6Z2K0_9FIRM|nr:hypothetical protein [Acetobacterium malicum]MBU4440735.1 hypothetical protein [Bacillota bacterium]MCG2730932.1 hypothetical protein [Acetobacterium sp.]MDK2937398.1 hypothetical protein [Eubacteriaceae bacterium]MDK2978240.1 hypothetical protein [Bacteroidales bacterium]PKM60100.1 MAG: hypothetical protein CVU99_09955 [Firmicutes bacterium HGW-Firmicutes-4]
MLRYLDMSDKLNNMLVNTIEQPILETPEFTPRLKADKRVNNVNNWQKPLCAEYSLLGMDLDIADWITNDAMNEIRKSKAENCVVFEPYALPVLKMNFEGHVCYYLDLLSK